MGNVEEASADAHEAATPARQSSPSRSEPAVGGDDGRSRDKRGHSHGPRGLDGLGRRRRKAGRASPVLHPSGARGVRRVAPLAPRRPGRMAQAGA